jgi:hypothetical protein
MDDDVMGMNELAALTKKKEEWVAFGKRGIGHVIEFNKNH